MREGVRKKRRSLKPDQVIAHTDAIIQRLIDQSLIQGQRIALYFSYHQEVMAERLMPWLFEHEFQVYFPVLNPDEDVLLFAKHEQHGALDPNYYGILEPAAPREWLEASALDTVMVPLVAFTARCERMGMGKGYYDKTFAFMNQHPRPIKPKLIGLAYDFQEMPSLVQHENDVRLDVVVTETQIFL